MSPWDRVTRTISVVMATARRQPRRGGRARLLPARLASARVDPGGVTEGSTIAEADSPYIVQTVTRVAVPRRRRYRLAAVAGRSAAAISVCPRIAIERSRTPSAHMVG